MKKYLLLLTASLTLTVAHGQTNIYHPFPDSAFWRVDKYYDEPFQSNWCFVKYYFQYYSSGDTLINSFVHKKIYRSFELVNVQSCSTYSIYPSGQPADYAGALRDDSVANKTFFVFKNKNNDSLLYDYNLIVGDTMKGFSLYTNSNLVVLSIDSVLINGQYRKRWNFPKDNNNDSTFFIAGVGSSGGLIEPLNTYAIDFTYRHLVCLKDSSVTFYTSTYISPMGCSLIINGTTEINSINAYSIYPNPFSTQTTLQTDVPLKNATLTLYNCFGQTVAQIKNINEQTVVFSRDNLASGLYFLQLTEDGKIVAADKLVIED